MPESPNPDTARSTAPHPSQTHSSPHTAPHPAKSVPTVPHNAATPTIAPPISHTPWDRYPPQTHPPPSPSAATQSNPNSAVESASLDPPPAKVATPPSPAVRSQIGRSHSARARPASPWVPKV